MAVNTNKVVEYGKCRCCGHRVKVGYQFCLGCHRKRMKILDDCVAAGMPEDWARQRVDEVYPLKFE
jgi:hypothetical protein